MDQAINARGMHIDRDGLADCCDIVRQAEARYTAELQEITQGAVSGVGCVAALGSWLATRGLSMPAMDQEAVTVALDGEIADPAARRALEIRQLLSGSSAKKCFAIERRLTPDGRLHDLLAYCGADRTGRWSGRGAQPQNLPALTAPEGTLQLLAARNLDMIEGCALTAVSSVLRSLFTAAPGYDLICSDYCAIEAVVLAVLAGEQWRINTLSGDGKLYERTGSMITGIALDQITHDHPARKLGKVAELASGYQGSVGAWRQFGATGTDEEILASVRKWRAMSPCHCGFLVQHRACGRGSYPDARNPAALPGNQYAKQRPHAINTTALWSVPALSTACTNEHGYAMGKTYQKNSLLRI